MLRAQTLETWKAGCNTVGTCVARPWLGTEVGRLLSGACGDQEAGGELDEGRKTQKQLVGEIQRGFLSAFALGRPGTGGSLHRQELVFN